MMLHQDHRLIYNNCASIELPNGMCFDYNFEVEGKDDFHLISPDGSFKLIIAFFSLEKSAKAFLEEVYEDKTLYTAIEPIHVINVAHGLKGYATAYEGGHEVYEEYAIDVDGPEHALFNLWTLRHKDRHYNDELCKRAVDKVLTSLQLIKQS